MTTAKNPVFIGLYLENCCLVWRGDQRLVGEIEFGGWGEKIGEKIFQLVERNSTPIAPNRENPEQGVEWGVVVENMEFPEVSKKQHVEFPVIN